MRNCKILLKLRHYSDLNTFTDDVKLKNLTPTEKTVKLQNPTTGQTPKLTNWTDTAPIKQVFTVYFVSQSIKRIKAQMGAALLNCPSIQLSILFNLHIRTRTNYSVHAQLGLVRPVRPQK